MKTLISLSKLINYLPEIDLKTFNTEFGYIIDLTTTSGHNGHTIAAAKFNVIVEYNKFLQTPLNIEMFWTVNTVPYLFPGFEPKELKLENNYNYSHVLCNKDSVCIYWFDTITQTWKQSTGLKTIADLVRYNLEYDETLIPK